MHHSYEVRWGQPGGRLASRAHMVLKDHDYTVRSGYQGGTVCMHAADEVGVE